MKHVFFGLLLGALSWGCGKSGDAVIPDNHLPLSRLCVLVPALVGQETLLDASSSSDDDGLLVRYRFLIADGSPEKPSANAMVTHIFRFAGIFAVRLTVFDDRGGKNSVALTIPVVAGGQPGTTEKCVEGRVLMPGDGGPPEDGGTAGDGGALEDGGAPDDGGLVTDGGGLVTDGGGFFPECEERGGSCAMVNTFDSPCPEGYYKPFSGRFNLCPTSGIISTCCVPLGGVASPCDQNKPCDSSGCLMEDYGYPKGGYCMNICEPASSWCPGWMECIPVPFSQAMGACMTSCNRDELCREGWSCQAFPISHLSSTLKTTYVCWAPNPFSKGIGAACSQDRECLSELCRKDPADNANKCTALCNTVSPCLLGHQCRQLPNCSGVDCSVCFPE